MNRKTKVGSSIAILVTLIISSLVIPSSYASTRAATPHPVFGNIVQVYAGNHKTFVVNDKGEMWGIGANGYYGSLGVGSYADEITEWTKIDVPPVAKVSGGSYISGVLTKSGDIYLCGYKNPFGGAIGIPDLDTHLIKFTKIEGLPKMKDIDCGLADLTTAVDVDGNLWACGANTDDVLGPGSPHSNIWINITEYYKSRFSAYEVYVDNVQKASINKKSNTQDGSMVLIGTKHRYGRDSEDGVFFTGDVYHNNTRSNDWDPVLPKMAGAKSISHDTAGYVYIVDKTGTIHQTYDNASTSLSGTLTGIKEIDAANCVRTDANYVLALMENGKVYSHGYSPKGGLGLGDTKSTKEFVEIPGISGAIKASAGSEHSAIITNNNKLYTMGCNCSGELGFKGSDVSTPKEVTADEIAPTISSITKDKSSWHNSSINLTINAKDNIALHASAYSFDNGKTWQAGNSKSFNSNQKVDIKVRDVSGNISSKSITIDNIDKLKPNKPKYEVAKK